MKNYIKLTGPLPDNIFLIYTLTKYCIHFLTDNLLINIFLQVYKSSTRTIYYDLVNRQYKEILKSHVINDYFRGKTREEIATQHNTSTGNVSHILRDFEKKVGESSVHETIEFARMVRRSGMTMGQCLKGFRMCQLADKLGINTDDDINDKNKDFQDFVYRIYFPCEELGIQPTWIFKWIEDLLKISVNLKNILLHDSIINHSKSTQQGANSFVDSSETYHEQYADKSDFGEGNQLPLVTCNSLIDAKLSGPSKTEQPSGLSHSQLCNPSSSSYNVHGLVLSDIIELISQVQNNCKEICIYHHELKNETIRMENTFTKVKDGLQRAKFKNQKILHFEYWFYRAKELLWNLYSIRIETELPKFIKVMNEFNKHNHDPYEIIYEYLQHQSLDKEIVEKEKKIDSLRNQIKLLEEQISSTRKCLEYKKNMENTVEKFESTNFGIDELMRIHNLIVEIASIKNIPVQNMVKIVVDDMEKSYYDNTLFSDLVNNKKAEYRELVKQYSYDNKSFEENYYFKIIFYLLLNRGISQQNIIDINLIITELEKRNFYAKNIQNNDPDKKLDIGAVNMTNNYNALINDLRKYVTLAIACKEKQNELDKINKQIIHLTAIKQSSTLQKEKIFSCMFFTNYRIPYGLI